MIYLPGKTNIITVVKEAKVGRSKQDLSGRVLERPGT
jgi:hypothetical protein